MCDKEHGCATCCMERALAIACAAWGGCLQWHGAGVCLGLEHLHAGAFAQDSKTGSNRHKTGVARAQHRIRLNMLVHNLALRVLRTTTNWPLSLPRQRHE